MLLTSFLLSCSLTASAPLNRVMPLLDGESDAVATAVLLNEKLVLTAAHATRSTEQVFACGSKTAKGHLIRLDMLRDLAVFVLEAACDKVDMTPLAGGAAAEGEPISIQGYPGSNTRKTTSGVVASYEMLPGPPVPRLYMIMDLLVSGGNSGGPVLNARGELVGIVQGKLCYGGPKDIPQTCYGAAIPLVSIRSFLEGIKL